MVVQRNGNRSTGSERLETLGDVWRICEGFTRRTAEQEAEFQRREAEERTKREADDRHARLAALAKDLGPRYTPDLASLDTFHVYHEAQKPVVKRLHNIAAKLPELVAGGTGIVLFGSVGTGKDHLAAALLYRVAETAPASWANGRKVFGES